MSLLISSCCPQNKEGTVSLNRKQGELHNAHNVCKPTWQVHWYCFVDTLLTLVFKFALLIKWEPKHWLQGYHQNIQQWPWMFFNTLSTISCTNFWQRQAKQSPFQRNLLLTISIILQTKRCYNIKFSNTNRSFSLANFLCSRWSWAYHGQISAKSAAILPDDFMRDQKRPAEIQFLWVLLWAGRHRRTSRWPWQVTGLSFYI